MKLKLDIILNCMVTFGKLFCIWPLDPSTKYKYKLLTKIGRYFLIMNSVAICIPYIFMFINNSGNESCEVIQILGEFVIFINYNSDLILFMCRKDDSQNISMKAVVYTAKMNRDKKVRVEKCINCYLHLLILIVASCISGTIALLASPIYLPQHLPFGSESITIMIQVTGLYLFITTSIVILLATAKTKLDFLISRIEAVKNGKELQKCIIKHQKITEYVKTFQHGMRFIIFKYCIFTAMSGIFALYQIIFSKHLYDIPRDIFLIIGTFSGIYLFSWAADDMQRASINISEALYHIKWIEYSSVMRKSIIIMMCRAQKPLKISISGFIPELTLKFVTKFLMLVISYFMGLRELIQVR